MVNKKRYETIKSETEKNNVQLVVVSKNQSIDDIQELYRMGHRHFGENKVQELTTKKKLLAPDICWHLIGHLQTNKAKLVTGNVHLFHALDSYRLATHLNELSKSKNINLPVLIELKVATEASKKGFSLETIMGSLDSDDWLSLNHLRFQGLMAMASFTDHTEQIRSEFVEASTAFNALKNRNIFGSEFTELSMGMSGDYKIAMEEGATIVRIGSLLFTSDQ